MNQEEKIWESPKSWRMVRVQVDGPDGGTVDKGIIRHPGAVGLVPITAAGEILMLKQFRLPFNQAIYEIPAGTKGWDEDWLICAQRELREETGFRAAHFESLGEIWPMPGSSDEVIRLYVATGLEPDPLPQDFDEEIEVIPMSFERCQEMILNGEINDGKTIATLFRYRAFLASRKH